MTPATTSPVCVICQRVDRLAVLVGYLYDTGYIYGEEVRCVNKLAINSGLVFAPEIYSNPNHKHLWPQV